MGHARSTVRERLAGHWRATPVTAVTALLAVAVVMRIWYLGDVALWVDESITLSWVAHADAWGLITTMPQSQPHLPGYYLVLEAATWAVGYDLVALRALSVVIALPAVPLAYLIARRVYDDHTALFAAFAVAVAPMLVRQSMEIRMYGMLATLGANLVWTTLVAADTGGRWRWATAAGAVAVGWTHPFGLLSVATIPLVVAARRWSTGRDPLPEWRAWLRPGVAAAVGLAWPAALSVGKVLTPTRGSFAGGAPTQVSHVPPLSPEWVGVTAWRFAVGWPAGVWDLVAALVIVAAVSAVVGRADRADAPLVVAVAVPWVVAIAVSLWHPVLGPKYLLATAVPAFVVVARGALALGRAVGVGPAVAVLLVVSLGLAYPPASTARWDWNGAADVIDREASPEAQVIVDVGYSHGPTESPIAWLTERPLTLIGPVDDPARLQRAIDGDRRDVWVVFAYSGGATIRKGVNGDMTLVETYRVHGIDIHHYRRTA